MSCTDSDPKIVAAAALASTPVSAAPAATPALTGLMPAAMPRINEPAPAFNAQTTQRAGRDSCKKQPFAFLALDVAVLLLLSLVLC